MRRLLVILAFLPACGEEGGTGHAAPLLDCSVMQSEDSCWARMLRSVALCAPSDELLGVYAEDRTSCHYEQGVEVVFTGPVPQDPFAPGTEFDWSFRMEVAGSTCVDWMEGEVNGWLVRQITTRAGLVRYETSGSRASLVCDDGKRYETDEPATLLACAPSRPLTGSPEATSVALGLLGQEVDVHVFTCGP